MPLHNTRLRERGYNQALELARPIAKRLAIPLHTHLLQRHKTTLAQARLSLTDRARNVENAFTIKANIRGCHVSLVDDVTTTGHTLRSASAALKQAGAKRVDIWCAAKAIL